MQLVARVKLTGRSGARSRGSLIRPKPSLVRDHRVETSSQDLMRSLVWQK